LRQTDFPCFSHFSTILHGFYAMSGSARLWR